MSTRPCIFKMSQDKNFRPVETCPECGEPSELALASAGMCHDCVNVVVNEKLNDIRRRRYHSEPTDVWVNRCNDVLRVYGLEVDQQYCAMCGHPTTHEEVSVDGMPGETDMACIRCDVRHAYVDALV